MTEKHGIKETKELLAALLVTATAVIASLQDGKIDFKDLGNFYSVFGKMKDGIEGISEVIPELKDLDNAEVAELLKVVENSVPNGSFSDLPDILQILKSVMNIYNRHKN